MLYDPNWKKEQTTTEQWRKDILDAVKVIEERGWCQRTAKNPHGSFCIIGALWEVTHGGWKEHHGYFSWHDDVEHAETTNPRYMEALRHIADYIEPNKFGFVASKITDWNDEPKRTKEQVISIMKEVATDAV